MRICSMYVLCYVEWGRLYLFVYLISLALISAEETQDYTYLFQAFKFLCHSFSIQCRVHFLMMDASAAEAAAARVFDDVSITMCYFHVTQNVHLRMVELKLSKEDQSTFALVVIISQHATSQKKTFLFDARQYVCEGWFCVCV